MSARHKTQIATAARTSRGDSIRSLIAASVGVTALILQLLVPTLARASAGDWVEICSDLGVVMVQLDLNDVDDSPATRPDCANCPLCLASASAPPEFDMSIGAAVSGMSVPVPAAPGIRLHESRRQRPEARGPPVRSIELTSPMAFVIKEPIRYNGGVL